MNEDGEKNRRLLSLGFGVPPVNGDVGSSEELAHLLERILNGK